MNSSEPLETMLENQETPPALLRKRRAKRQTRRTRQPASEMWDEARLPAVGTMARTKRLIMAALRVWELKRGIRD
jgi:hypothetical protein